MDFQSSSGFIHATVCIAVFVDQYLYGILLTTLPYALKERIHISQEGSQYWTAILLSVHAIPPLVLSPVFGYLVDRFSKRLWWLRLAIVIEFASTLMICFGLSLWILVLARLFHGISGAMLKTGGVALLLGSVESKNIGRTLGILNTASVLATILGPPITGAIYDSLGYYSVYYLAFAMLSIDVCFSFLVSEKPIIHDDVNIKLVDTNKRWPPVLSLLLVPRAVAAIYGSVVLAIVKQALNSTLQFFVIRTFNWPISATGLVFLTLNLPGLLSPLAGYMSDIVGSRVLIVAGLLFSIMPLILLRLVTKNSVGHKVLLCVLLALARLSFSIATTPLKAELVRVVHFTEHELPELQSYGQVYSLLIVCTCVGQLAGPNLGSFIDLHAGFGNLTLVLAMLNLTAVIPIMVWTGGGISFSWLSALIGRPFKKSRTEPTQNGLAVPPSTLLLRTTVFLFFLSTTYLLTLLS